MLRRAILPQNGEGPKQNCRIFTGSKARPGKKGERPCLLRPRRAILYRKNGKRRPSDHFRRRVAKVRGRIVAFLHETMGRHTQKNLSTP